MVRVGVKIGFALPHLVLRVKSEMRVHASPVNTPAIRQSREIVAAVWDVCCCSSSLSETEVDV